MATYQLGKFCHLRQYLLLARSLNRSSAVCGLLYIHHAGGLSSCTRAPICDDTQHTTAQFINSANIRVVVAQGRPDVRVLSNEQRAAIAVFLPKSTTRNKRQQGGRAKRNRTGWSRTKKKEKQKQRAEAGVCDSDLKSGFAPQVTGSIP